MYRAHSELMDLLEQYIPEKLIAESTALGYRSTIGLFDRFCHYLPLAQIRPLHLGTFFQARLRAGRSPNTVHGDYRVLRLLLAFARKKRLSQIRLADIPVPKRFRKKPRAWSTAQFEAMLAAAARLEGQVGPWPMRCWLPALMLTVWSTGWRITANMHIRTARVDLAAGSVVSIESKTHEERCAELVPEAIEPIKRIWDPRRAELFGDWPHDRGSRQWKVLNRLLKRVISDAGVPDIGRWHAIRRTGSTAIAIAHGIDAATAFCGHRNSQVTRDSYVDPTHLARGSSCLPRLEIPTPQRQILLF